MPKSPTVIAVLNQKGGVGKTTLAVNLAAAAHLEGRRVVIIDLDKQGSAFEWFLARDQDHSRLGALTSVKVDRAITSAQLARYSEGFDMVVLDGPARLGEVTRAAALAADIVLMPVQPGPFDMWASGSTLELLDEADGMRASLGRGPVRRVFVVNRATVGSVLGKQAPEVLAASCEVAPVVIHQRLSFAESAAVGESVLTTAPDSPAAAEITALYQALLTPSLPTALSNHASSAGT